MSDTKREDRDTQPGRPPHKSQAFYRALFESANDAIFLLHGYTFVDCNPRTSELFGFPKDQLLGRTPYAFSPPMQPDGEDSKAKAMGKIDAALAGQPQCFDWRHVRQDGTPLDAEVGLNRIEIDGQALVLAVVRDVTAQRQAEAALRSSRTELRILATKMTQVEDAQRMQIAQGLHDMVAQNLAAAILLLRQVTAGELDAEARATLNEVVGLVDQTADQLRHLSFQLSPPSLNQLGLGAAIADLAERLSKRHKVEFTVEDQPGPTPLPIEMRSIVYRCVAELLTNAARHADARQVTTRIQRHADHLVVSVEDDGVGFDTTGAGIGFTSQGGLGLFSVRERLSALGGEFRMESTPGDGTRAVIRMPIHGAAQAEATR